MTRSAGLDAAVHLMLPDDVISLAEANGGRERPPSQRR
jgi:hypothetical protein